MQDEPESRDSECWGFITSMENGETLSLEQMRAFFGGQPRGSVPGPRRWELYEWVNQTLRGQAYGRLKHGSKGLLGCYIAKMTGVS
jgi:hypothetical protein